MEKIIGFRRATGTYEGKPYDNFYLVTTATSRKYYGVTANETKVKTAIILDCVPEIADGDFIENHPQVLLGVYVEFFYNRFGQVADISLDPNPDDVG